MDDFVYSIRINRTVRHVCFSGTFVRELTDDQWPTMLESIGYLQTLEELQIWCSTIPVDVFAHTVRNATRLRKIYLFRVQLAGSQADFDDFAGAVRGHPALRDIRIGGFQIQSEEENVTFDAVVEALGSVRTLEVVNLQLAGPAGTETPFTGDSLIRLTCSPNINDLYLSRLGLRQEHFNVIAVGLMTNSNLRVLDLFGNVVTNDHVALLCESLEKNTSLETLVLPCPSDDLTVDSCKAISRVLQVNRTLVTLNLPRSNLDEEGLSHIAQGLTVNTTLKKIEVGVKKDLGSDGERALTQMLEKNYELERLVLSSAEKSIKDKVEYYMRLNEVGRGALLRNHHGKATREQWVEMLISVTEDLDCLFYFLTTNPALCQIANANSSKAEVIITEEYRRRRRRHTLNHFSRGYSSSDDEMPAMAMNGNKNRRASAL